MNINHAEFMKAALNEAVKAKAKNEVPIGAVIVAESGDIISSAHNQTITLADPTAHAEILALRNAAQKLLNYRLLNTTIYVTIEPCIMCMGAIIHSRVSRLVFGSNDPKWGAAGSLYNFAGDTRLNHQPEIINGVRKNDCRALIQAFFKERRNKKFRERLPF